MKRTALKSFSSSILPSEYSLAFTDHSTRTSGISTTSMSSKITRLTVLGSNWILFQRRPIARWYRSTLRLGQDFQSICLSWDVILGAWWMFVEWYHPTSFRGGTKTLSLMPWTNISAALGVMNSRRSLCVHWYGNGIANPFFGVWAKIVPWSKDFSCRVWSVTPVNLVAVIRVCWSGAGPRKLHRYLGLSVGKGGWSVLWQ